MLLKHLLITICAVFITACQGPLAQLDTDQDSNKLVIQLPSPSGEVLDIELAMSPESRTRGLMFREHMDENQGMAFLFERERPLSFWMKNTLIPLDILFINAEGRVVDIQTMEPCPAQEQRCPSYLSVAPASYAVELNKGAAETFGFQVGTQIDTQLFQY